MFFAGIVSTGNNTQLAATLHSVLRQKLTDARLDICIFYEQENVPQSEAGQDVILIPYKSKEDFFSNLRMLLSAAQRNTALLCGVGKSFLKGLLMRQTRFSGSMKWLTG